jgi:hypothetical protein
MLIPENIYRATVVEADMGKAGTGIRQVALLFEISRGPFEARRYTWYGPLNTRGNAKRSAAVLHTCGFDGRALRSMLGKEVDSWWPQRVSLRWPRTALEGRVDASAYPNATWEPGAR